MLNRVIGVHGREVKAAGQLLVLFLSLPGPSDETRELRLDKNKIRCLARDCPQCLCVPVAVVLTVNVGRQPEA